MGTHTHTHTATGDIYSHYEILSYSIWMDLTSTFSYCIFMYEYDWPKITFYISALVKTKQLAYLLKLYKLNMYN